MVGIGYDGVTKTDRLLDFSTAHSSAIYFVPGIDALLTVGTRRRIPAKDRPGGSDFYFTRSFPCVFVPPHCCPP